MDFLNFRATDWRFLVLLIAISTVLGLQILEYKKDRVPTNEIVVSEDSSLTPFPEDWEEWEDEYDLEGPEGSTLSQTFQYPYAVEWEEEWSNIYNDVTWGKYKTKFSLTGVSFGERYSMAPRYMPTEEDLKFMITLHFLINSEVIQQQSQSCIDVGIVRIIDETGGRQTATPSEWMTEETDSCALGDESPHERTVSFAIPYDEKGISQKYLFNTGKNSNRFFEVSIDDAGEIQVRMTN